MDYKRLSKHVSNAFVKHGFWKDSPSDEHCLMLVIAEVGKAVYAWQHNRWADKYEIELIKEMGVRETTFQSGIFDTVDNAFANIVMQLLELAGKQGVTLTEFSGENSKFDFDSVSFTETAYWYISKYLTNTGTFFQGTNYFYQYALQFMERWAKHLGIDLEWFVYLKLYCYEQYF